MTKTNLIDTELSLLGKTYYIRHSPEELSDLMDAANYLKNKLTSSLNKTHDLERVIMVTALNVSHDLLLMQKKHAEEIEGMNRQLQSLFSKLDEMLTRYTQMEIDSAE